MIIQCENCEAEFNFDESLIKEGGSKVRCSACKNIFKVYPSVPEPAEEPISIEEPEVSEEEVVMEESPVMEKPTVTEEDVSEVIMNGELEETVALDSPPVIEEVDVESMEDIKVENFDKAFEDALEEDAMEVAQEQPQEMGEVYEEL